MSRSVSRTIAVVLLAGGVAALWFGGAWAWRLLLRLHGVH